jgi:AraC-like DNA-binding protein
VRRTSAVLATQQTDFLKIVAPWHGVATVTQNGRQAQVRPGQWTIYDSTQEYEVANPERCEHLIITLPKSRFTDNGRAIASIMGSYVGGTHGVSRITLDVMRGIFQECPAMGDTMVQHMTDTLVQLVQLSLMEVCGRNATLSPSELLNERIKTYVRQHLRNTDLSVEEIAQALHCSKRHLYNAFQGEDSSLSQFIWQERIALFQRELQHPHWQQRTITELALSCGFTSSAHFSRMFKQQIGQSPAQYKQQMAQAL